MSNVSQPGNPGEKVDPSIIRAADEALDQLDDLLDREPPTSRRPDVIPPDPLSRIAVRADGVLLLSLEDAGDRDLTGRVVVRCLVLSAEETAFVRECASEAHDDIAARLIGGLPRTE